MDLLNLKIKSVRTQLDYLKVDLEYKQKVIEQEDIEFLNMMNNILDENEDLKQLFNDKEERRKEKIIEDILRKAKEDEEKDMESDDNNIIENEDIEGDNIKDEEKDMESDNIESIDNTTDPKIKKLYRKIVKLTHPDKVKDEKLNTLYLNATMYYDTQNIYGIYTICDELKIEYDLDESELIFMDKEVNNLKNKIVRLEGTFTWKWSTAPNDDIKKQIIIEFINMRLNQ